MTLTAHDERLLNALAVAIVDRPRATLKELAASAGVSKATLHRFCGTRDNLLEMLDNYGHSVIRQILEAAELQQAQPLDALRRLIGEHLKHREMLAFLLFQYRAESLDIETTTERWRYYTAAVDAFFLRGQQIGVFRIDITAAVFTELFLSMVYGMVDAVRYGRAASSSSASVLEQLFLHGALVQGQAG
ncbi:TetR/AcrR family transcriptional regulator [Pseudomonas sp. MT3]|uniref:TetR/AcrR family transcriptional regulator n=1 Tax=Pseudomonas sp. ATCC 13867 TaxID=1294143 RepID=UPI000349C60D|nr:TetR/AcrR family transcriptional regulator [Pseudomonas sp. ATCC 13867]RFQ41850.1 TetR/AcrR family transcriptional regulator [Pseudomonas sp. ATCC 13867]